MSYGFTFFCLDEWSGVGNMVIKSIEDEQKHLGQSRGLGNGITVHTILPQSGSE